MTPHMGEMWDKNTRLEGMYLLQTDMRFTRYEL